MEDKSKSNRRLNLKIITIKGVVYDNFVKSVKITKKDGVMIINRNYSSVMEQLAKGNLIINEESKKISAFIDGGWLTISDNKCSIYSYSVEFS